MRDSSKDILSGFLLLFLAVGVFLYSFHIRVFLPIDIGSGMFPRVVAVMLGICSLLIIRGGVRAGRKTEDVQQKTDIRIFGIAASIVCMGGYILVLDLLGFILSSILYLFAQLLILAGCDKKKLIRVGVMSLVAPVVIYGVFVYGFSMILPECALF